MANLEAFRAKVEELLRLSGIKQQNLAIWMGYASATVSKFLHKPGRMKPVHVEIMVEQMAEHRIITFRRDALMLLRLMDCESLAQTGKLAEIVNKLRPDPPSPLQDAAVQRMGPGRILLALPRTTYLNKLVQRYRVVALPLTPLVTYSFEKIYQPLQLRLNPFVAEDLAARERRALLDEPTRGEYDPRRAWPEQAEGYPPERRLSVPPVVIAGDIEEALTRSNGRVMVLGSLGAGKTTLLQTYASALAGRALKDASARLPIYLALSRHIGSSPPTLRACLSIMLDALGMHERYVDAFVEEIEQGQACVCVDGLDELPINHRKTLIDWICGHAAEPGNIWVIASRFADYRHGQFAYAGFAEWELQPLTPEKRHALVHHLIPEIARQMPDHEVPTGRDAGAFLKRFETHPRVSTWGNNPLMLSLTTVVYALAGSIPSSRAELYRKIIDAVLQRRPVDQHRLETVREAASFLALRLVQQQRRTLTQAQLLGILHERWPSRDEELAAGLMHAGLLEVVAKGLFGYWHHTYQEYFAAEALAQQLTSEDPTIRERTRTLLEEKWIERQWGEILRLLIGILVSEEERKGVPIAFAWLHWLLDQHLQPGGADVGDLALALALQSLGEVGTIPRRSQHAQWQQLEQDAAQAWVQALLQAADQGSVARQERLLAVAEEINHFTPSLVQQTVQQLTASFTLQPARIRAAVIAALGKLGLHVPVDLLTRALGDRHEQVREAVVRAWVELGEDASLDRLVGALHSERVAVRLTATRILGELRQPSLLNHLLAGLRDEEPSMREATVIAIGSLGTPDVVRYLRKGLRDKEEFVQVAAVEALGKLSGEVAERALRALLKDDFDDSVRAKAIQVLGKRAPLTAVIEELRCPPLDRPYSPAYHAAVEALRECDEGELARARARGVGKRDPAIWDTIQALREAGQEPAAEELVALLDDHDLDRRYVAANLLGRRNEWEPLEQFLVSVEEGTSGCVRAVAARLLGWLGEEAPVDLLVRSLSDTSSTVRLAALQAFEEMEDRTPPEAAAALSLLNDRESKTCATAMRVVANVSEHILVDVPLLETLFLASEHPEKPMRQAALLCLRRLEKRVTDGQFAALLRHEDASIRLKAVKRFGPYGSVDQIQQALHDTDPRIRTAALNVIDEHITLFKGKEEELLKLVEQATRDEAPSVREAAARLRTHLRFWKLFIPTSTHDEESELADSKVSASYWDWSEEDRSADAEGGLVDSAVSADNPGVQSEKPLRPAKRWGDRILRGLAITIDADHPTRPTPGPDEELFPLEEAKRNWIRKRVSMDQLSAALTSDDGQMRLQVLQALEEDVPEEDLRAALDDEAPPVRRKALQLLAERTPMDLLARALGDDYVIVREVAMRLLKQRSASITDHELHMLLENRSGVARASAIMVLEERIPRPLLIAALGDSEETVRLAAFDALRRVYRETLPLLSSELTALLTGTALSRTLKAVAESLFADLLAHMEHVPLRWLEKGIKLLEASYWEVRMKAAQALGTLHRDLPPGAIDRLQTLRRDPASQAVRIAADDALAEILSCERAANDPW